MTDPEPTIGEATERDAIREATAADHDAIVAGLADLQDVLRALYPPLIDGRTMARGYFNDLIARGKDRALTFFVCHEAARLTGLAVVWVRRGVDELESTLTDFAEVTDLWVAADRRGQGLGTALLRRCERFARDRGLRCLQIGSLAANTAAREAYGRFGFTDYALSMRKTLA